MKMDILNFKNLLELCLKMKMNDIIIFIIYKNSISTSFFLPILSSFLSVDKKRIVFSNSKSVFGWMPSSHFYFLSHIYFHWFLFICCCSGCLGDYLFTFICPICAYILSSFIHKFHINLTVRLILNINYMNV